LDQIRAAVATDVARGTVLADAAYGINTEFRDGLTKLGLPYMVGVQSTMTVWGPGQQPLPAKPRGRMGRPPRLLHRSRQHQPVSVKQLALSLPASAFKEMTWREAGARKLRSRFAAVRIRPAHRDYEKAEPYEEEWLLIEWPRGEAEPTKYWVSTLPPTTSSSSGQDRQTSLDHRAGLRGTETGTGAGALRGPQLAWISPSCHAVHRSLWVPGGERNRFFPLRPRRSSWIRCPRPAPDFRRAARRVRPERHNPYSIATLRIELARWLLRQLPHCPFCGSPPR